MSLYSVCLVLLKKSLREGMICLNLSEVKKEMGRLACLGCGLSMLAMLSAQLRFVLFV